MKKFDVSAVLSAMFSQYVDYLKTLGETPATELRLTISKGNRKTGEIPSVSLPPLMTCDCTAACAKCGYCYAVKMCRIYPSLMKSYLKNLFKLQGDRDGYFREISEQCAMSRYFRWHVSGDIPDFNYLCRMVAVAQENPGCRMWAYTKKYALVNKFCEDFGRDAIPENLVILFSEDPEKPMENPYNFPVFAILEKGETVPEGDALCGGNCTACAMAGAGCPYAKPGTTTWVYKH